MCHRQSFAIVTYDGKYVLTEYPEDEYVLKEAILNVMIPKKVDHFLEAIKISYCQMSDCKVNLRGLQCLKKKCTNT